MELKILLKPPKMQPLEMYSMRLIGYWEDVHKWNIIVYFLCSLYAVLSSVVSADSDSSALSQHSPPFVLKV